MILRRKFVLLAVAAAVPIAGMAMVAPAGATLPPPAKGTVSCKVVTGAITFSPALTLSGTAGVTTETATVSTTLKSCTAVPAPNPTKGVAVGKIVNKNAGGKANACTALLASHPVNLKVTWTRTPAIAPSVVAFSGYSVVTNAAMDEGFHFPNLKAPPTPHASVTGSYPGADKGAKSVTQAFSNKTAGQLLAACESLGGLKSLAIASGTAVQK
jgi:hypothetical protein